MFHLQPGIFPFRFPPEKNIIIIIDLCLSSRQTRAGRAQCGVSLGSYGLLINCGRYCLSGRFVSDLIVVEVAESDDWWSLSITSPAGNDCGCWHCMGTQQRFSCSVFNSLVLAEHTLHPVHAFGWKSKSPQRINFCEFTSFLSPLAPILWHSRTHACAHRLSLSLSLTHTHTQIHTHTRVTHWAGGSAFDSREVMV